MIKGDLDSIKPSVKQYYQARVSHTTPSSLVFSIDATQLNMT